jgi:hypothetical protein
MRSAAVKMTSAPVNTAFVALVFVIVSSAFAPEAVALPGIDRAIAAQGTPGAQKARWVCGPYRCWRQPGWGPGYGWGGGPGWRRPWGPRYGWGGGWGHPYW